jgi:hypothetical protein
VTLFAAVERCSPPKVDRARCHACAVTQVAKVRKKDHQNDKRLRRVAERSARLHHPAPTRPLGRHHDLSKKTSLVSYDQNERWHFDPFCNRTKNFAGSHPRTTNNVRTFSHTTTCNDPRTVKKVRTFSHTTTCNDHTKQHTSYLK